MIIPLQYLQHLHGLASDEAIINHRDRVFHVIPGHPSSRGPQKAIHFSPGGEHPGGGGTRRDGAI